MRESLTKLQESKNVIIKPSDELQSVISSRSPSTLKGMAYEHNIYIDSQEPSEEMSLYDDRL